MGVQNLERGVTENGDFRQGRHYPWVILASRVTGESSLTTQRSIHSAIHERVVGIGWRIRVEGPQVIKFPLLSGTAPSQK
jgi:hypothetical protein